jgi:hypothetical protein
MPTADRSAPLPHEASLALGIIAFHLAISVLHGSAHVHYEIPLAMWQHIFIGVVIFVAPLAAGGLLLARRLLSGAWLLLLSMASSALFNVYFHFLLIGPDNISSVSLDGWGLVFLGTAIFLAAIEVWGGSVSFRLIRVARRLS